MRYFISNLIYKLIDTQEYFAKIYFQFFEDSIISIRAYSDEKTVLVYHILFSIVYPLRFFKANDIVYDENVLLEIVHNKEKSIKTTVMPSRVCMKMSALEFKNYLGCFNYKQPSILDFSLNNVSFIKCFNVICHSFNRCDITTSMFANYLRHKYTKNIQPPYILEVVDNDFAEHIFKGDQSIKLNKPHDK